MSSRAKYLLNKRAKYEKLCTLARNCEECTKECSLCPIRYQMDSVIEELKRKSKMDSQYRTEGWTLLEGLPVAFVSELFLNPRLSDTEKVLTLVGVNVRTKEGMQLIAKHLELYHKSKGIKVKPIDEDTVLENKVIDYYRKYGMPYTTKSCKVTEATVRTILRKHSIPFRPKKVEINEMEVVEHLNRGNGVKATATKFAIGTARIYAIMSKNGIKRRGKPKK